MEQQGDDVASWWPWNVFEVLVSCYGDVMEAITSYRILVVGAFFPEGTVSSIPIGGNISPGGFSPSILLVVILVTVVIVVVVLVVVVIGVVIVVAIIGVVFVVGGVSFIIKF
ncbi:hypothetical protein Tco_0173861 [Tanacetum coccineum]